MLSVESSGGRMLRNLASVALLMVLAACVQTAQEEPSSNASMSGTWVGEISGSHPEDTVTVRLVLKEQGEQLIGETFAKDPILDEFYPSGSLEGMRSGSSAQWKVFEQSVSGTFSGDSFSGRVTIESDSGQSGEATIRLQRQR